MGVGLTQNFRLTRPGNPSVTVAAEGVEASSSFTGAVVLAHWSPVHRESICPLLTHLTHGFWGTVVPVLLLPVFSLLTSLPHDSLSILVFTGSHLFEVEYRGGALIGPKNHFIPG